MARSFNGTSDNIQTTGTTTNVSGVLTIAAWVYETTRGTSGSFWTANINGGTFNEIISATGEIKVAFDAFGFNDTGTALPLTTWSHVATAADGSNYFVYFNGSQIYTTASTTQAIRLNPIVLGAYASDSTAAASANFFAGRIADAAVWNIRLTAAEINALANGARPGSIRPASLISWLPLDGLASPEPDLSGNKNNGTLTGTALAAGPPVMQSTPRWPQFTLSAAPPVVVPIGFIGMPGIVIDNEMISI